MTLSPGELCPMAQFEMIPLGKPFNEEVMPLDNPADKYRPFRHKDEMSGYCCDEPRCAGYLEVHEKVKAVEMFCFYL